MNLSTVSTQRVLTVDYRNFNKGKQKECEDRVKHTKYTKLRYDAYDDLKIKQTK